MHWEALTAIGTIFTSLVILFTVLMAARQVRAQLQQVVVTGRQVDAANAELEHLERSNQLSGAMAIFAEISDPRTVESARFVTTELKQKLAEQEFRAGYSLVGIADESVHKELIVLRVFERVGAYIRHGLIDGSIIYDVAHPLIIRVWESLHDLLAMRRREVGGPVWENCEYLYQNAKRWATEHGE